MQGGKSEKDISDFFALGNEAKDLKVLLNDMFTNMYAQTMMILQSCEIDYDNPPDASKSVVAVNGVPLGTQDNLFCITGGEGTGKSNYIAAILAGTLGRERLKAEQTLGLEVTANPKGLAVLHYDTEQSEAQLYSRPDTLRQRRNREYSHRGRTLSIGRNLQYLYHLRTPFCTQRHQTQRTYRV